MILEVCVDSVAAAVAAERGGAQRIELCSSLVEGGITPSPGLLAVVRSRVSLEIMAMIRPRGGDFLYSEEELEVMRNDIGHARELGADGIVLGLLDPYGRVDQERTRELVEQADPLPVTFHRAIDLCADPLECLEPIIATGATRILTSGAARSAVEGAACLRQLVAKAAGRIEIMAAGGITPATVHSVAASTGVREFHASLRVVVPSPMLYRNEQIAMGEVAGREYLRYTTLEENVRSLSASLTQLAEGEMRPGPR
jgi:copper homeostasis protein